MMKRFLCMVFAGLSFAASACWLGEGGGGGGGTVEMPWFELRLDGHVEGNRLTLALPATVQLRAQMMTVADVMVLQYRDGTSGAWQTRYTLANVHLPMRFSQVFGTYSLTPEMFPTAGKQVQIRVYAAHGYEQNFELTGNDGAVTFTVSSNRRPTDD